jgi:hypothetical protein
LKTLIHQITVKRLNLKSALQVTPADADFSKLAYYNQKEQQIFNGGNPFISNTVSAQPFDQNLVLNAGVHLHFILPSAITHFSNDVHEIIPAPNRWLIKKTRAGVTVSQWVLESDCLLDEKKLHHHVNTILPINIDRPGYNVFKNESQPFQFMGRVVDASTYFSNDYVSGDRYWEDFMSERDESRPFTAFAYGNLNFSSFYPNCRSVFGFHDVEGNEEDCYEVFGWYHLSEDDITPEYLEQINKTIEENEFPSEKLNSKFGIHTSHDLSTADQILFYAKVKKDTQSEFDTDHIKVALANDTEEAFSAWIADEITPDTTEKRTYENLLEALQFDLQEQRNGDLAPTFESERHARGFDALQSNIYFDLEIITKQHDKNLSSDKKQLWLLEQQIDNNTDYPHLKAQIEALNNLILQYEKQKDLIYSKRQLLHAHWQKYLQSYHPPIGMEGILLDPNKILTFIKDAVLPDLEKEMVKTGWLSILQTTSKTAGLKENQVSLEIVEESQNLGNRQKSHYLYSGTPCAPSSIYENTIAQSVIHHLQLILVTLNEINQTPFCKENEIEIGFKHLAGQRYFEPSTPVVLLGGESLKTYSETTQNQTQQFSQFIYHTSKSRFKPFLNKIFTNTSSLDLSGFVESESPIIPLYMDWEVYFFPTEKINAERKQYYARFITDNFNIKPEDAEFSILDFDRTVYSQDVSRYSGRSLITSNSEQLLNDRITQKKNTNQEDFYSKIENCLNKNGFLIQSLNGFNQAFVQEKLTLQLPIGDPIAFEDYKHIYQELKLADYIANQRYTTPIPEFEFSPIRMGGVNITKLALIDSFGKRHSLAKALEKKVTVPETLQLTHRKSIRFNKKEISTQAFLYPRFVQPGILRTNWLPASQTNNKEQLLINPNTKENPVCGWVVPNHLAKSLSIYSTHGTHLGDVTFFKGAIVFEDSPEHANFSPDSATNYYLKQFLKYLKGITDFQGFLTIIDECLFNIDPDNNRSHSDLNYLFGRPMALVRMQLSFELKGSLHTRKDHYAFEQMLQDKNPAPVTAKYEDIKVPVRVGDYRKLNEGVVMYWHDEDINSKQGFTQSYSTALDPNKGLNIKTKNNGKPKTAPIKPSFHMALSDQPRKLTMLIDPRGEAHICSGVLPMTTLKLPDRYWKNALQNLKLNFEVGPLLFPQNQIQFNLPHQEGYSWNWLQNRKQNDQIILTKTPQEQTIQKTQFDRAIESTPLPHITWDSLIAEQILITGVFGQNDYAYVQLQNLPLKFVQEKYPKEEAEKINQEIIAFFEQYATSIKAFDNDINFSQNELHDGWAELYKSPVFPTKDKEKP